jgi:hypothetical protein
MMPSRKRSRGGGQLTLEMFGSGEFSDDEGGGISLHGPRGARSAAAAAASSSFGGAAAAAAASDGSDSVSVTDEQFNANMADATYLMRSNKYEEDKVVDYQPVCYSTMNWDALDQYDRENTPGIAEYWDECQLCNLDQTNEEREAWGELENIKRAGDRYSSEMTPIALARLMRRMYDRNIKPNIEGEFPMRTRMFWMHIDEHAPTPRHMIEDALRNQTNQLRVLRDCGIFEQHSQTKAMRVAQSSAVLALKIEKERKFFLKMAMEMRAAAESKA